MGRRFRHFVEINFEETPEAGRFFDGALTARPLAAKLAAFAGRPVVPGETLLFLDEVQRTPRALASLRYFREQMPGLRVVAAGPLLEFAPEEVPSFGVGRVTSRFLYPMTFPEFLRALGEGALAEMVGEADFDHPLDAVFHERLVDRYRTYLLVGGMPEAVAAYAASGDPLAELAAGLALVASQDSRARPELYYWQRASRAANAEVDYVIAAGSRIVPVEVKAGTRGSMQSLRLFLKEKGLPFGVRLSLESFGRLPDVRILPLYAAHRLPGLCDG